MTILQGVYPPVLTPFRNAEVAHERLAGNLDRLNAQHGLISDLPQLVVRRVRQPDSDRRAVGGGLPPDINQASRPDIHQRVLAVAGGREDPLRGRRRIGRRITRHHPERAVLAVAVDRRNRTDACRARIGDLLDRDR